MTRTKRSALSLLLGAVLALVIGALGLMSATPALAHDQLIGSNPKNDAVLDKQPDWIELEFSGDIQQIGNEIQVNHKGKDYSAGEIAVEGRKVTSALPDDLEPGKYEIVWRVVSSDGHPISGVINFTIKDSNAAGGTASEDKSLNTRPGGQTEDKADNADQANQANQDATADTSATGSESENQGMSPAMYIVIGVVGLVAVIGVVALFIRKNRGLEK